MEQRFEALCGFDDASLEVKLHYQSRKFVCFKLKYLCFDPIQLTVNETNETKFRTKNTSG